MRDESSAPQHWLRDLWTLLKIIQFWLQSCYSILQTQYGLQNVNASQILCDMVKDWPYFRQVYLCISAQPCVCSEWFKPCGLARLRLESYSQTNFNEFSCCSLYEKPHIRIVINNLWLITIILVLHYCVILLYHWTCTIIVN